MVWAGFAAMIFASFMSWFVLKLPPAQNWPHQGALEIAFGSTPRILLGSLIAFFCGEFCNSYVLAKMKIFTKGKFLWSRTIGSTIVGEGVDSIIFYPVAFWGTWENSLVIQVMIANYLIKVGWEVLITPFTYIVVNALKKVEHEDYYDYRTNFTPFSLKT